MRYDNLDPEMSAALARLESSFRALAETRDMVGRTLDTALDRLIRQIDALDTELGTLAVNKNASGSGPQRDAA